MTEIFKGKDRRDCGVVLKAGIVNTHLCGAMSREQLTSGVEIPFVVSAAPVFVWKLELPHIRAEQHFEH